MTLEVLVDRLEVGVDGAGLTAGPGGNLPFVKPFQHQAHNLLLHRAQAAGDVKCKGTWRLDPERALARGLQRLANGGRRQQALDGPKPDSVPQLGATPSNPLAIDERAVAAAEVFQADGFAVADESRIPLGNGQVF